MMNFDYGVGWMGLIHLPFLIGLGLLIYWLFKQNIARKDILAWAVGLIFLPMIIAWIIFLTRVPNMAFTSHMGESAKEHVSSEIKSGLDKNDWQMMRDEMDEHFRAGQNASQE